MKHASKFLNCLAIVSALAITCTAQSDQQTSGTTGGTGRITGTVTVDGKPAGGVLLIAYAVQTQGNAILMNSVTDETTRRARSGSDGGYTFNELTAGSYLIRPFAPAFAEPPATTPSGMETIAVEAGESVDGIDLALSRGAIVTGRVTRTDGRPAVEIPVVARLIDQSGKAQEVGAGRFPPETDDRGIYRIYGLNPGRYTVCAQPHENAASSYLEDVFYSSSDKSGPATITLGTGEEIGNIDITLGNRKASYEATGQAIGDAGNPVADAVYFHNKLSNDQSISFAYGSNDRTDRNGRFRLQGLANGRHQVSLVSDAQSGVYSDPTQFEVKDQDVSGIQIHAHTGASISGVAVIEGNQDQSVLFQLQGVKLQVVDQQSIAWTDLASGANSVSVGADGSFQASGLTPGTKKLYLAKWNSPPGFSLLRVERDGVPVTDGIAVSAGQQVIGLRAVLGYGTAVLRGQVAIQGGTLPSGTQLFVRANMTSGGAGSFGNVDARGRFEIDGLCDGQYQIAIGWSGTSEGTQPKQIVTVSGGQTPELALVLDLTKSP